MGVVKQFTMKLSNPLFYNLTVTLIFYIVLSNLTKEISVIGYFVLANEHHSYAFDFLALFGEIKRGSLYPRFKTSKVVLHQKLTVPTSMISSWPSIQ